MGRSGLGAEEAAQAEVTELDDTRGRDEHVGRLDVCGGRRKGLVWNRKEKEVGLGRGVGPLGDKEGGLSCSISCSLTLRICVSK